MTYKERKERLICELETVSDSPAFEATELMLYATGIDRSQWLYNQRGTLTAKQKIIINYNLSRRKHGVPLQYILGEWEFYSLPFYVGKGVLIPRADSELLVDLALDELSRLENATVFDLCSGSGAIGIAVAHNKTDAKVTLVEKSRAAFKYLTKNCERNKVELSKVLADITLWQPAQKADIILCNPPYITADEMRELQKEVKKEPSMALFGGKDGLSFYRLLSQRAKELLKLNGKILMEIGYNQANDVTEIFKNAGFSSVEVIKDLSGNDRVVSAVLTDL